MYNQRIISFFSSRSAIARPSVANTFRFGFRPTGFRFETLLTRNASRYNARGCVIWTYKIRSPAKGNLMCVSLTQKR